MTHTDRDDSRRADHYQTLQVTRVAEPEVIERAYRALALKYHPDVAPLKRRAEAHERMQSINEAFAVLRDPELRARYDASLPPEGGQAWERFMEAGLIGLLRDRYDLRRR